MQTFDVVNECPICGHLSITKVEVEKYLRWRRNRELIQNVWPESTPQWRETLKTGIHEKCWASLFKEDEV